MTPEQNLRQALIDNVPHDRLVETIAKHLYRVSHGGGRTNKMNGMTPRDWYRASFLGRKAPLL